MYFNSFQFLVFLVVVFTLHFALPHRFRIWLLFVASYYFYSCWEPSYLLLVIAATVINYVAALAIDRSSNAVARRWYFAIGVTLTLSMLFVFKYLDFAIRNLNAIRDFFGVSGQIPLVHLLLPAGISFFTFQMIGYTTDVFRRDFRAEPSLLRLATFKAFFPQLVAGPIERVAHLLPQFNVVQYIRLDNIRTGLQWILLGVFKKMVIADSFAVVPNTVFSNPERFNGPIYIVATLFFGFQVYCDFAGYSDIAVGVARLFGFDLFINFKQPFMARSVAEHWQRWHITLNTWFRDYVYIPLGGRRVSVPRWIFNIYLVFVLSGFWHGANWTFVGWGLTQATYLLVQHALRPAYHATTQALRLDRIPILLPVIEWAVTFVLIFVSYIFFRALYIGDAIHMITHLLDARGFTPNQLLDLGLPTKFDLARSVGWIVVLMTLDFCLAFRPYWVMRLWSLRAFRWAIYASAFYAIACFGVFEQLAFIYFQF